MTTSGGGNSTWYQILDGNTIFTLNWNNFLV
jgi:hypothetical protein